jgi:hypothetical protein
LVYPLLEILIPLINMDCLLNLDEMQGSQVTLSLFMMFWHPSSGLWFEASEHVPVIFYFLD